MIYQEIDITKELPPNNNISYIVKYNGKGSWYEDEISDHTGEELNGAWKEMVKVWLKPITLDLVKAKEKAKKILDRMAGTTKSIEDYIAIIESYGYVVIKQVEDGK